MPSPERSTETDPHASLNEAQRQAVMHGDGPLLIIAGAGSGKTHTLAHRVAELVLRGADPRRILLLTFTRRAAAEMTRRAERIVAAAVVARGAAALSGAAGALCWAGTFHAVANRLLRLHAEEISLDPAFTVLDRADAEDLLDWLRSEQRLGMQAQDAAPGGRAERRFPRKSTCLAIYSRAVNACMPLREVLETSFPWCLEWEDELRALFSAFVSAKQDRHVLDYDDLLLWWMHAMDDARLAKRVSARFDYVLVDEYQDTNSLQARILERLKPDGTGVTVVGDDAQSIYSFRAATVRNILDFPRRFSPPAAMVTLDRSYRSTQRVLDAANAVIALSAERFTKDLWSANATGPRPRLVTVEDEDEEVRYVADRVLLEREGGLLLRQQAVLFRAAHHSDALEVELSRRGIPFVKYGGLKFLEAAHVKDVISLLRWAENPRDEVAALRVLKLLPGMGPAAARRTWRRFADLGWDHGALGSCEVPRATREDWSGLCAVLARLADPATPWPAQIGLVRGFYEPHMERLFDHAHARAADLAELEALGAGHPNRERFLSDLTLDPPEGTGAMAGPPHLDEDFLILSTIHSAKGQEWEAVAILHVTDGCIPSDMATGSPEEVEEERRLLYVAMTRARSRLALIHPLRFRVRQQARWGDRHVWAQRSRFLPDDLLGHFERETPVRRGIDVDADAPGGERPVDVGARLRGMWT